MSTIQIQTAVPDHSATRDAFGRAAYAGELPKAVWGRAQDLVGRYDDATDDVVRAAIAGRMNALIDATATATGPAPAPAPTRIAA